MRFNEIYRALKEEGIQLSKPTLSDHLKHLIKQKFITRKAKGVQNVTYFIHKGIERKTEDELEEFLKSTGFDLIEPSPKVKAELALKNILEMKLRELVLRIEIEPKINMGLSFTNTQVRSYENHVIRKCRKDEKYRNSILGETKALLKIFDDWANLALEVKD